MPLDRRKIFYIDKVFQKRVLALFLGLSFLVVISNLVYYFIHLRKEVQAFLYQSHIEASNIADVILRDVLIFNLILTGVAVCLAILALIFVDVKTKHFFKRIHKEILCRMGRIPEEKGPVLVQEEFQEIDSVTKDFFQKIDIRMENEQREISQIKEILLKRE